MKITRKITSLLLAAALALAGCKATPPTQAGTPSAATARPGEKTANAPGPGDPIAGDLSPAARPTTPAVPALSQDLPAFDGLYWTSDVGVEPLGEHAVRLVSGLPCENLIGLLAAGEWRVAKQASPKPEQMGQFTNLVLLERNAQLALADVRDQNAAPLVIEGEPTPTPLPADAPQVEGCTGVVQVLTEQTILATGVEEAQGQAQQYPFGNGCIAFNGGVKVSLFYEGPGDFHASVDFTVPAEVGEYPVDETDFSLEILRSEQTLIDQYADLYARGSLTPQEEDTGVEYYAASETAGTVKVTSVQPLAGEIALTDFANDDGASQTFQAGFRCEALK